MRLLLMGLMLSGCLGPTGPERPAVPTGPGKHVLFVGNSLTYFNALPQILETLADSAGEPRLETAMVAFPNYSLEDHWAEGSALEIVRAGGWHHVVLQQGPSSLESSRALLIRFAVLFDSVAKAHGGESALYSVWPARDRQQDFPRAAESYRIAADSVHGLLFPVADAWIETWRLNPDALLYFPDGTHPSLNGSYLAALVMYSVLYGKTPVGLPASFRLRDGRTAAINPALAATLQQAAWSVSQSSAAR